MMKRQPHAAKVTAYVILAALTLATIGCLLYWNTLPEQKVASALSQANDELNSPLSALGVAIKPQTDRICNKVLKNPSKTGNSTYGTECRITQEGFIYITADPAKHIRGAGPLSDNLRKHGWKSQVTNYDATTWLDMITYRVEQGESSQGLHQVIQRKQFSTQISCEFDMLVSGETAGQVAVYVTLQCLYNE